MKSNKKFPPAMGAIVGQALKDKSAWIGKTVQELTCEAIRKRGLSQEDVEGCVCLTLDEAKELALKLKHNAEFFFLQTGEFDHDTDVLWQCLSEKIEQAKSKNESLNLKVESRNWKVKNEIKRKRLIKNS